MQAYDAVIFDFGGVLTSSPFEAFARFERERGLPESFIRQVNSANHLENAWAKLERAEIDHDEFDRLFTEECRALGHEVNGRDVLALISGAPRPDMIEALRRIHARLKTGCITNNLPASERNPLSRVYRDDVLALFHHVVESSKIGLRKPDPRIYRMMVEALDVAPGRCIYLDDIGVNLKPARAMGMTTIKVGDPGPAIDELERCLGFALR